MGSLSEPPPLSHTWVRHAEKPIQNQSTADITTQHPTTRPPLTLPPNNVCGWLALGWFVGMFNPSMTKGVRKDLPPQFFIRVLVCAFQSSPFSLTFPKILFQMFFRKKIAVPPGGHGGTVFKSDLNLKNVKYCSLKHLILSYITVFDKKSL